MLSSSVSVRETRGLLYQLQRVPAIHEGLGIREGAVERRDPTPADQRQATA